MRTSPKSNTTPVWSIVVATAATWSRLPFTESPSPSQQKAHKSLEMEEKTHLSVRNEGVRGGVRQPANFQFSYQEKGD